jgi:hypothetical protein
MKKFLCALCFLLLLSATTGALTLKDTVEGRADFPLLVKERAADILVAETEAEVVRIAANLLATDIERISSVTPSVRNTITGSTGPVIIAATLGKSTLLDQLISSGKLKEVQDIQGRWEATLWKIVDQPIPGVERALVIVGSDRRGTAYGLMRLSEIIGISPWNWWADVSPVRRTNLVLSATASEFDAPAVKYRGIFINDEDWGLHPWAKQNFEPEIGGIGPKTYEKIFELMLRLRLNYIWPAMHEVTHEFHSIPQNIEIAHRYGIVVGASHCEPMLFNNAKWVESEQGKWDYSLNRDTIHAVWEDQAKIRGDKEAVWGLGIRGIHDRGMEGPNDPAARIAILNQVFHDQRSLIDKYVTKEWGPVAQAFVPYKEVLPLYDAGLAVPDDVTLVWVDDNFGYIRRLGKPEERSRTGGAGIYWHLSYYGRPHSYLWINSTAPALMWEELHKAWENDARRIWVINVGDIKPAEIGISYFADFAWHADSFGPDSQPRFLHKFATEQFGLQFTEPIASLLNTFYHLGTVRKPELMERSWALSLTDTFAEQLRHDYQKLIDDEEALAGSMPENTRDAYFEMIGFPARVLGATGLIFLADRATQFGEEANANAGKIARLRSFLEKQVRQFNQATAGGKWNHLMPGPETAEDLTKWNSQVRWPWGENPAAPPPPKPAEDTAHLWRNAASADQQLDAGDAKWTRVDGLGHTGRALALKPASLKSSWQVGDMKAPTLVFNFETKGGDNDALIDFMPTFRLYPGMQLRVAVSVDDQAPVLVEVPGSNGKDDENGPTRRNGIQNNYVRADVPLAHLAAGKHVFRISAVDPGAVIDRVALPR